MDSTPWRASGKIQKIQVIRCMARIHFIGVGKETIPCGLKCNIDECEGRYCNKPGSKYHFSIHSV
jgi:hypothetical protein